MSSVIGQVLTTVGSAAVITAILAFLAKAILNQLLERNLEAHKNELKRQTDAELIEVKGRIDSEIADANRQAEAARVAMKATFDHQMLDFQAQIAARTARADRVRTEIEHWANPILGAVRDLAARLKNILESDAYPALAPDNRQPIAAGWSLTSEYFWPATLFAFGQYFCWVRLLEERLRFDLFRDSTQRTELLQKIRAVNETLSHWPMDGLTGPEESDRQVFNLQQRALGEAMVVSDGDDARCMRLAQFLEQWEGAALSKTIAPVARLLEHLQPGERRWGRLEKTLAALRELEAEAQDTLTPRHEAEAAC